MINVTNGFLNELFNGNRNYYLYLTINLKDGTTLNLTNKSIWGGGFSVEDAVSGDDNFDVGSAIINTGTFILNNIYDEFSAYDFTEATVMPEVGLMVNGSVEKIKKGKFIVDEATYDDSLITLNCFDNMIMLDKEVDASLFNYPMTLRNIVTTICSACNVLLAASSQEFPHYSFQISSAPDIDACTYRELLSWVAQIAGCYARFNTDGNLELKWYDFDALNSIDDWLDGGRFDGNSREFQRKIGEIDSEIQPYLNTEVGMTTLRSSYSDDDWKGVGNDIDFEFNGSVKDNIFVDTNSCFAFTNSWPSQSGRLASVDVNVLRRDGSASKIKWQTITSNGYRIKKFLFSGHIVYGSGLTDDKKLEYEIFFVNDGVIAINFITLPTNTSYTMDSSILENGTKYPFTPTQDGVLYLVRNTNGEWESVSNSAYTSGDVADGGSFNPWDTGYVFDAGGFNDASDAVHYLTAVQSHTISVDDVVITGVRIFVETESQENGRTSTPYITGTDDYVIEIDRNPLITESNVQSILAWLGTQLIGTTFRKANLSIQSNPSIEAGDVAVAFDRKGNCYKIVVSRSDFTAFDSQQIVSSAKSPVRNASQRIPESTRTIAKVVKEYKEELSAYDVGVKMITDFMSQSIGYYKTDVIESGATVTYLHDKATLAQSTKVWKRTVDGFATSSDGGQTWISGWTYDGNIVVNHIATHGVSADWINTGTIVVKSGSNIVLSANADTGAVSIGGFDVTSSAIKTKNKVITSTDDGSIGLSSANFTRTINSRQSTKLRFALGGNFGVDSDGVVYSSAGYIGPLTIGADSNVMCAYTCNRTRHNANEIGVCMESNGNFGCGNVFENGWTHFMVDPTNGAWIKRGNASTWTTGEKAVFLGQSDRALSLFVSTDNYTGINPLYIEWDGGISSTNENVYFKRSICIKDNATVIRGLRFETFSGQNLRYDTFYQNNGFNVGIWTGGAWNRLSFFKDANTGDAIFKAYQHTGDENLTMTLNANDGKLWTKGNISTDSNLVLRHAATDKRGLTFNNTSGNIVYNSFYQNNGFKVQIWTGGNWNCLSFNNTSNSGNTIFYAESGENAKTMTLNVGTGVFWTSGGGQSDEKIKNILTRSTNGFKDIFMKLRPITFKWKDKRDDMVHIGIGARETEKYLFESNFHNYGMIQNHDDDYSAIYTEIFMLSIPVVQEHENVINSLKQEICELKEEIAQLKSAS